MLDHKDSPYIRALGFLYLRYVCNPKELWEWFRDYVKDEESFSPSPAGHGKTITIGTFARDILLDQVGFLPFIDSRLSPPFSLQILFLNVVAVKTLSV